MTCSPSSRAAAPVRIESLLLKSKNRTFRRGLVDLVDAREDVLNNEKVGTTSRATTPTTPTVSAAARIANRASTKDAGSRLHNGEDDPEVCLPDARTIGLKLKLLYIHTQ